MTWVQHKAAEIYTQSACIHKNHTKGGHGRCARSTPMLCRTTYNDAQEDVEISIRMLTVAFYARKN